MSKLNVQIKIWAGEGAIIKIKHASMTLRYIEETQYENYAVT